MNIKKIICCLSLIALCSACQTAPEPEIIEPVKTPVQPTRPVVKHPLGIIGAVEPIYILPMKTAFQARVDTGAKISALDVDDYYYFERDGIKWVSFKITNNQNNETYQFEKPFKKFLVVRRIKENEKRPTITLNVKFGGKVIKADFTLAKREKFDYQVLIGRNILSGRALIDPSLSNTLR